MTGGESGQGREGEGGEGGREMQKGTVRYEGIYLVITDMRIRGDVMVQKILS